MANPSHTREPHVTAAMVNRHRQGWHFFVRLIYWHCIGIVGVLLLLLTIYNIH
ncbi:MAG: hypothetical protein AB7H77_01175 [Bdellovibrionales bacterium]